MPSKSKRTVARRKHLRPHDKPGGQDKAALIQQLHALGWRGRDLRQIIHVTDAMERNLRRFQQELRKTVKRRPR